MAQSRSEISRRWRENNPEATARAVRNWAQNNKEARNEYMRNWNKQAREKNPEKYKMMVRQSILKRKYGLTHNDYEALLLKQEGACAICRSIDPRDKRYGKFHVDHCHDTGRIRGLLCNPCNLALGKLGDNVESIEKVLRYLKGGT